jgi:hypothetical protein
MARSPSAPQNPAAKGGSMMKRFGVCMLSLVCVAALNNSCVAQDNPWNGTWKLDPATIKYDGPTFTIASDAEGYTVTRGGKADPKVVCDGTPKTNPNGNMVTCTKAGTGYAIEVTRDGKPVNRATVSLSPDGKMMTRDVHFTPADDSPYTMTFISKRVSGGPGVSGVWKQMKVAESADTGLLTIQVTGDSVDFKETDVAKPVTCKLDGTETNLSPTSTMSVKLADPHTLKVTYKGDGQVRRENTFVLSVDGKTVTETDITPDPSPSTTSMMFHKS